MAAGKYSPTVSHWYYADQEWHRRILAVTDEPVYDHEGYDSYGYNREGKDRAGHEEHEYIDPDLHERVWNDWSEVPVPSL